MSYRTRVTGTVLVGLLLAAVVSAQSWAGRGRLSGGVQDPDGNPVEGASVKLTLNGAGPEELQTNQRGRWARAGLRGGSWEVLVSKPGFISTSHTAQVQEYASPSDRVFLRTILDLGAASATDGSAAALAEGEDTQAARDMLEQGKRSARRRGLRGSDSGLLRSAAVPAGWRQGGGAGRDRPGAVSTGTGR